jgi:hypothetical protein
MRGRSPTGLASFLIYLILSLLFFGRGLVGHLSDRYIGVGTDPGAFIFFLEWWKYILVHHVNPFITHLQWAPSGANLAWATCIPLFGIAAAPLTATIGPIATYNLLMLLCPALATWTAFLLCRNICSSFWSAVLGGYVFGFSPFMLGHLLGHLDLVAVFPIPLIVVVALLRLNGKISGVSYIPLLSALLVVQFLCFAEVPATATLFGGFAIFITWLIAPQWRARLQALIVPTCCAYLATTILLSPYLYYFFAVGGGRPAFPSRFADFFSAYPSNFFIPTTTNLLGTFSLARKLCTGSDIGETTSYIALPLLLFVIGFARARWREWEPRLLVNLLVIICVASLGPSLHLRRSSSLPMPWIVFSHLPLFAMMLTARFSLFIFLILGIILSLWLSDASIQASMRIGGAILVVLFTLPNLHASYWVTNVDTPSFFKDRLYTRYLAPGDNLLVLPYGMGGNSNIWQATTGFYFRMAGGYVGFPIIPSEYQSFFPLVSRFYDPADFPLSHQSLKAFLVQKNVSAIIVADEAPHLWAASFNERPLFSRLVAFDSEQIASIRVLFGSLGVAPIEVGGVSLYRVPLEKLQAYKTIDPHDLERRIAAAQLDTLLEAAEQFPFSGNRLSDLNPVAAERMRLLPPRWVVFNALGSFHNDMVLMGKRNGDVIVGVTSSRAVITRLASNYQPYATASEIWPFAQGTDLLMATRWILLLEYDRAHLAAAAALARQH